MSTIQFRDSSNNFDQQSVTESNQNILFAKKCQVSKRQRAGKKCMTIIEDLAEDLDKKRILKFLRKTYNTNGAILMDENGYEIIKLQGNLVSEVVQFLVKTNIYKRDEIIDRGI